MSSFEQQLEDSGTRDPRPTYRRLLRDLKESDPALYDEMVGVYETEVDDSLDRWLAFGRTLAGRCHPGRTVAIEEDGRARPVDEVEDPAMILHLPDNARTRAVPVRVPAGPSPAQDATLDVLVHGRNRSPES